MEDSLQPAFAEHSKHYRQVNDGIYNSAGESDEAFICECLHQWCNELVELRVEQYVGVRCEPDRFVVVPGHELADIDAVLERNERFVIVKRGRVPDAARRDPESSGVG